MSDDFLNFISTKPFSKGEVCFKGSITSDERCAICGGKFEDDRKSRLYCPLHPDQQAGSFRVNFGKITKRFKSYQSALACLTYFRSQTLLGEFEETEYRKGQPYQFNKLVNLYLETKEARCKRATFVKIKNHLTRAKEFFGNENISKIKDTTQFLFSQKLEGSDKPVSDKTRSDMKSSLHDFFTYLVREKVVKEMPFFPETPFVLKRRKTVDKTTQQAILDMVYELTYHINPKVYIACLWLATYPAIRPNEMRNVRHGDFNLFTGRLLIPHPKEKTPKEIALLPEDMELFQSFPSALPSVFFFRHKSGQQFGKKYFYKMWIRACSELGIEGVDLYAGTKHSSASEARNAYSYERVKKAAKIKTNSAFDRYLEYQDEDDREVYRTMRPTSKLTNIDDKKQPVKKF